MISILEQRFPHAIKRLTRSWGDAASFGKTFSDLTLDTRGDRSGWPFDAWLELMFLQEVHDLAHGSCGYEEPFQELEPAPHPAVFQIDPDSFLQLD